MRWRLTGKWWLALVLILGFMLVPSGAALAATTNYGDVNLSSNGTIDSGHFADVWDLTKGDMTISFTYDGNGLWMQRVPCVGPN